MASFPDTLYQQTIKALPRQAQIEAIVKGTRALDEFARQRVRPIIDSALQKTLHEQAMTATYYRTGLLWRGLAELEDPHHFQIAAMVGRSIFELLLDLKALGNNAPAAQKFFDFTRVSRYHRARQLEEFLRENPSVDTAPHKKALDWVNKPGAAKEWEQLCRKHGWLKKGEPKSPEHWSGKTIAERAQQAGIKYMEIYRSQYFVQSYYVHAGAAGIDSMSRQALESCFAMNHLLVQPLFAEATKIICEQFHLFEGDESLRQKLEEASNATGFFALHEALTKVKGKEAK